MDKIAAYSYKCPILLQLSLLQLALADNRGLGDVRKYCPTMQVDFWACLNRTLQAIERGSQWSGRRCCSLALSPKCQNSCATSSSKDELTTSVQENGDICCSSSRTSECFQACRKVFEKNSTHFKKNQQYLKDTCNEESNPEVFDCIEGQRRQTPLSNYHQ
uniref:Reversion-inducing cysteine-rich with Kazal motifs N-terminal domain-containing protein n=1 Tax=Megaselia scalaris TaxID=36166 RepID=T1GQ23_MEGSC